MRYRRQCEEEASWSTSRKEEEVDGKNGKFEEREEARWEEDGYEGENGARMRTRGERHAERGRSRTRGRGRTGQQEEEVHEENIDVKERRRRGCGTRMVRWTDEQMWWRRRRRGRKGGKWRRNRKGEES